LEDELKKDKNKHLLKRFMDTFNGQKQEILKCRGVNWEKTKKEDFN